MDTKRLVIYHGGSWVGNCYEGGLTKLVHVPRCLTYDALVKLVQDVTKLDAARYTIELRLVVCTNSGVARPIIENDNEVSCMMDEDKVVPEVYVTINAKGPTVCVQNGITVDEDDNILQSIILQQCNQPTTQPGFGRDSISATAVIWELRIRILCALSIENDRFTSVYQYDRGPCSCPLPLAPCFKVRVTVDGHAFESPNFFKSRKTAEHAAVNVALMSFPFDGFQEASSLTESCHMPASVQGGSLSSPPMTHADCSAPSISDSGNKKLFALQQESSRKYNCMAPLYSVCI
ncbi:hypothetical protein EZV62_008564 [Acer yangbiense]|uniref:DRBM domain-containing protein n=1 Tax=Acer yangbiense TaxID=1000413 RepID=A0A5C7IEA4_9ROSI|nr:hypothetical protein EZV62_008564 [Acer yangbiense]